jgi:hypothetical protein
VSRGGKTLEEIEVLFSKDGPHPWQTHFGESKFAANLDIATQARSRGMSVSEFNEKNRLQEVDQLDKPEERQKEQV